MARGIGHGRGGRACSTMPTRKGTLDLVVHAVKVAVGIARVPVIDNRVAPVDASIKLVNEHRRHQKGQDEAAEIQRQDGDLDFL